jgi:hypothetical protein
VHRHHHQVATYTGAGFAYPPAAAPANGFCQSCCHPAPKCCCNRQCRKESRELLVQPTLTRDDIDKDPGLSSAFARTALFKKQTSFGSLAVGAEQAPAPSVGIAKAFIGGACCVYLSIEYAPQSPTADSMVVVMVDDSEGTVLAWGKIEQAGASYCIKECIITTKPGADLTVIVANMTARVRWCEVFSC